MPRKARFAPPGYWLHLTQRGNNQQRIFASDADRQYFLRLLETHSEQRGVRIAAYTLMSNHFHLVAVGDQPDAISLFMMSMAATPLIATPSNAAPDNSASLLGADRLGDDGGYEAVDTHALVFGLSR